MLTSSLTNPILEEFRLMSGARNLSAYDTHEWLFQLARHWALWQSPRVGTFPLEYRDPSGPATLAESRETGEDSTYWDVEYAIACGILGYVETVEDGLATVDVGALATGDLGDRVQDAIRDAVTILDRLDDHYEAIGRGI